ncbi:MAG: S4 domain-containing protein, partial [Xanthobacteraceae bacterium]
MTHRERADRLLVARGLFDSRARAQAAIAAGRVTADGIPVRKASEEVSAAAVIAAAPEHPYV